MICWQFALYSKETALPEHGQECKMARGPVLKSAQLDVADKGQEKAEGDKFQVPLKGLIYLQETVQETGSNPYKTSKIGQSS